jgi:putative pyruvate formate lyase activating enzyme
MRSQSNGPEPTGFSPAYRNLPLDEIRRRAGEALDRLRPCRSCPRRCGVDRLADEAGQCLVGRHAVVSSFFAHHGEEDCLRGWRGSGTIFFCGCNLKCVFCQNADISQHLEGRPASGSQLARMMLALQKAGCHNVNWVSPAHVVPQILEALPQAVEGGLDLPLVYNTNGYDTPEALALLDGIVDIYMPDFKLWSPDACGRLLTARDYGEVARRALLEMHRQVGDLEIDSSGLARRGLLIRHLVMPHQLDETRQVLRWIAQNLGTNTYINLMNQYRPANRARQFEEISLPLSHAEFQEALQVARQLGLHRLDRLSPAG